MNKKIASIIGVLLICLFILYAFLARDKQNVIPVVVDSSISTSVAIDAPPKSPQIFFVKLGDNGKSGISAACGDSMIGVDVDLKASPMDTEAQIKELIRKLMITSVSAIDSELRNPIVEEAQLELYYIRINTDGVARIYFTGDIITDDPCRYGLIEEQLRQSLEQLPRIDDVLVYINGMAFESFASSRDKGFELPEIVR